MDIRITPHKQKLLSIAVLISLLLGAFLLAPYFSVIALSLIAAYTFFPIYRWLATRLKREGLAAALTSVLTLLVIVLPLIFVSWLTFQELQQVARTLSDYTKTNNLNEISQQAVERANILLADVSGGAATLDLAQVREFLVSNVSQLANTALGFVTSSIEGIGTFITSFILYIYIFTAVLLNHRSLLRTVKGLDPLGDDVSKLYLKQAGMMTTAMVRGQFIIAALQGMTGALALFIAGVDLFWLMTILLTVLSIIPLGGGIVSIPIGIVLLVTGNIWQGLLVLGVHFLVVTNIDNILRPMLVPKAARLNSALTILSVFAGISLFGLLGIVIGPVLMILIVTTVRIYLMQDDDDGLAHAQKSRLVT